MRNFALTLALRHLRSGKGQTLLTISAVAAGVIIVVFISAIVFGIRKSVMAMLTDVLPHITVETAEEKAVPLARSDPAPGLTTSRIEKQNPQRKFLGNWSHDVEVIRGIAGITAVVPVVMGQGILSHGGKQVGTQITGADPESMNTVISIGKFLIAGKYHGMRSDEIVLNYKSARDLGVATGDRVRFAAERHSASFLIAGIYDPGRNAVRAEYITLRPAQSLFETGSAVTLILIKGESLYRSDALADRIATLLPVQAKSWSREFPDVLGSMNAYDASAYLISGFSLVASGFAIASILIVSVVQKGRQIGILKGIGATSRQIMTTFLLEGLFISLIGSVSGAVIASALILVLGGLRQPASRPGGIGELLFPSDLTWQLVASAIASAIATTVLAAALPARQAAHLDPAEVLR